MNRTSFSELLRGFSRQTRDLLRRYAPSAFGPANHALSPVDAMRGMARDLVSTRGEASGIAIASDLLNLYARSSNDDRSTFFKALAAEFDPDPVRLEAAWSGYKRHGSSALPQLARASEAPRQELFRRLNLAPGATLALVQMRNDLLTLPSDDGMATVDADLLHVLQSWFNRGFLSMQPISWSSPASLLERVIRYEAVHDISDWSELRSRLDPPDRRCFGFFHPAMPEEPLIFVEVALTRGIPKNIQAVLAASRTPLGAEDANTAVFYSISNCQPGLRGISFGHFLIKQVATDLKRDLPNLATFVTLSPIPGYTKWLRTAHPALSKQAEAGREAVRDSLLDSAVEYFLEAKTRDGKPLDPVARFHLGNGARLEQLNWMADSSDKGLRQSAGMMVNYIYDLGAIEELHETYANQGLIATGKPFDEMASRRTAGSRERKEKHR